MTTQHTPSDLKTILLEVMSDTRLQAIVRHFIGLSTGQKRLLLRIARGFGQRQRP